MQSAHFFRIFCQAAGIGALLAPVSAIADDEVAAGDEPDISFLLEDGEPIEAGARVFVAPPVGRVIIGADQDSQSVARYGSRVGNEGSGLVQFSTRRPSTSIAAGISTMAGSAPAGLPLASSRITSHFGARRNPVTGSFQRHAGVDLAAPTGAPVLATGAGVVSFAGPAGNYGLLVALDHGNGVQTRYAHLSRLGVQRGQTVASGDILGAVGSTGRSTGPHLHYEVRSQGFAINPLGN